MWSWSQEVWAPPRTTLREKSWPGCWAGLCAWTTPSSPSSGPAGPRGALRPCPPATPAWPGSRRARWCSRTGWAPHPGWCSMWTGGRSFSCPACRPRCARSSAMVWFPCCARGWATVFCSSRTGSSTPPALPSPPSQSVSTRVFPKTWARCRSPFCPVSRGSTSGSRRARLRRPAGRPLARPGGGAGGAGGAAVPLPG